ncbi:activating signal cointegrator 1 [Pelomyxa schiedti]|nr:activating signal cointegrator 1 [Pelomyxa schiedti]
MAAVRGRGRGSGTATATNASSPGGGSKALTLHQPWASLLVYGIKTAEGRNWTTNHRGKLWIHAASKQPDPDVIRSLEEQYRLLSPDEDLQFPKDYPLGALVGRVEVVDCIDQKRYQSTEENQRDPNDSEFLWLCSNPERLTLPFRMSGNQRLWNIPTNVTQGAQKALVPMTQRKHRRDSP